MGSYPMSVSLTPRAARPVPHAAPRKDPLGEVGEAILVAQDRGDVGPRGMDRPLEPSRR